MTILFYSPFNNRARDAESLMLAFHEQGHRVISLSQAEGKFIHDYLRPRGIITLSCNITSRSQVLFFVKHIIHFIRFCYKNKIDVVYSHLELPSFVSVVSQFFIRARVYVCRHHIDEASLQGFDKTLFYRVTYRLAKKIVVVSNRAVSYMVDVEKIPASKIIKINLAYDFALYNDVDSDVVNKIKTEFGSACILLTVCRLTKFKRPDLSLLVLKNLLAKGVNAKLIVLGKGEEENNLKELAENLGLSSSVSFRGHVQNVLDYLTASDFLLHPSILESSCVTVKEAGITRTPVIACRGIGDFDEYIKSNDNGFLVNKENFCEEATSIVLDQYKNGELLNAIGDSLNDTVRRLFNISNIIHDYKTLNSSRI